MRNEIKIQKLMNGYCQQSCFPYEEPSNEMKTSMTNVYIKGLPTTFSDDDMVNLVPTKSAIRSVKAAIEDDKRCKGYGFIDFMTPEDARSGLAYMQEKNPLFTIKFAKENEKDKTNLYVTNLPKSWTSRDSEKLKKLFERFGEIQSAFIMVEKYANKPLGVGFVRFFNEDSAYGAITDLESNPILVSDECIGPLEAKYADKHGTDFRRKNPTHKLGTKGKLQSSSQLPLLTDPNSAQLFTALFDNNYVKSPYVCTIPPSTVNDAYSQYLLNIAQYGLIDPYCILPTMVAPTAPNYYSAYGTTPLHNGSFYPNMFYSMPSNLPGDQVTSSNIPCIGTGTGQNPILANIQFVPNFNQIVPPH